MIGGADVAAGAAGRGMVGTLSGVGAAAGESGWGRPLAAVPPLKLAEASTPGISSGRAGAWNEGPPETWPPRTFAPRPGIPPAIRAKPQPSPASTRPAPSHPMLLTRVDRRGESATVASLLSRAGAEKATSRISGCELPKERRGPGTR